MYLSHDLPYSERRSEGDHVEDLMEAGTSDGIVSGCNEVWGEEKERWFALREVPALTYIW